MAGGGACEAAASVRAASQRGCFIPTCASLMANTPVLCCAVLGLPLQVAVPAKDAAYVKDDFFDQLSCDTLERLHLQEEGGEHLLRPAPLCLWLASVAGRLLTGSCAVVRWSGCTCRRGAASSCSSLIASLAAHAHRRAGGLARQDGGAAQGGCGDFWRHG